MDCQTEKYTSVLPLDVIPVFPKIIIASFLDDTQKTKVNINLAKRLNELRPGIHRAQFSIKSISNLHTIIPISIPHAYNLLSRYTLLNKTLLPRTETRHKCTEYIDIFDFILVSRKFILSLITGIEISTSLPSCFHLALHLLKWLLQILYPFRYIEFNYYAR